MIEIRNLRKSFDGRTVLDGIDLDIPDGKTVVIAGCSGCGKTVLLRSIIGLVKPDAGSIRIDGQDITAMDQAALFKTRQKFGMLFQGAALFDSMTVEENVGLGLKEHTDLSRDEIRQAVKRSLRLVGLRNVEDKHPSELSGGMKKRVGLARALVMEPRYVLYDEPTTGLDPIMSEQINRLILRTHERLGVTSIVVTHDMHSAFMVGDVMAMIVEGRVVFHGGVEEFKRSAHPVVNKFATLQSGGA